MKLTFSWKNFWKSGAALAMALILGKAAFDAGFGTFEATAFAAFIFVEIAQW